MALRINHNISAMNTQRTLANSSNMMSKSLAKLSSGYKINVASDDPSGLIISEQLRSQTHGMERAVRNSQEASNVIGIAEGALIEINEMLRTMRGLAMHAANSGVTALDQIAADQAEVDSSIATIDRIANTTKYSDQFLLNGSKSLIYDVNRITGNSIVDTANTRLDQVFKREGLTLGINFNGGSTRVGVAEMTTQAERAMFEADAGGASDEISIGAASFNLLTADQSFILTGNKGSMQFSFSAGTDISQLTSAIENVSDSTGIHADIVFASGATADVLGTVAGISGQDIYGMRPGINTDDQGRLFFAVSTSGTVDVYRDSAGSNLVASATFVGTSAQTIVLQEQNDSGISGSIDLANNASVTLSANAYIQPKALTDATMNETGDSANSLSAWGLSGVDIGFNTDPEGRLYVSVEQNITNPGNRNIVIYKDSTRSVKVADSLTFRPGGITAAEVAVPTAIRLDDVQIDTNKDGVADTDSGIGGFVTLNNLTVSSTTELRPQLGARMYTSEYGDNKYLRIQATKGKMWEHWNKTTSVYDRVDSSTTSVTVQANGQDARIAINGTTVLISGLEAEVTTPVFSGLIAFNEGSLFNATIAQTGYGNGNASSRIGDFFSAVNVATGFADAHTNLSVNAGQDSASNIFNISNGMQFQLGETDGDQSRTVYGIPSMGAPTIGQVTIEGTTYTLQDVLGGGPASLSKDPIIAMKVISQAINDVSTLRARLGAFQKNTLQTNINSLKVTIENVTMTESAIRDADMAAESTDFTRNQILVQAGTAMLAQANTVSQNVLQLLQ